MKAKLPRMGAARSALRMESGQSQVAALVRTQAKVLGVVVAGRMTVFDVAYPSGIKGIGQNQPALDMLEVRSDAVTEFPGVPHVWASGA